MRVQVHLTINHPPTTKTLVQKSNLKLWFWKGSFPEILRSFHAIPMVFSIPVSPQGAVVLRALHRHPAKPGRIHWETSLGVHPHVSPARNSGHSVSMEHATFNVHPREKTAAKSYSGNAGRTGCGFWLANRLHPFQIPRYAELLNHHRHRHHRRGCGQLQYIFVGMSLPKKKTRPVPGKILSKTWMDWLCLAARHFIARSPWEYQVVWLLRNFMNYPYIVLKWNLSSCLHYRHHDHPSWSSLSTSSSLSSRLSCVLSLCWRW